MGAVRALVTLTVAAAAAAAAAPAGHAQANEPIVDQGVVQSVADRTIVIRALDGSSMSFVVGGATRVLLNGARVTLSTIRPGFVAEVTHRGTGRAFRIRALGRFAAVEHGVVRSVSRQELLLEREGGGELTIPVTRRTKVRRGGVPIGRWAVRPGRRVTVLLAQDGSARVVILRRRDR
jgi:hypothetical protein